MVVVIVEKNDCVFNSDDFGATFAVVPGAHPARLRALATSLLVEPVPAYLYHGFPVPGHCEHGVWKQ